MFSPRAFYLSSSAVACGCLAFHTYYVTEREKKTLRRSNVSLTLGTVDDAIADTVKSGDLVVFERDCSAIHAPYALHCFLTKVLLGDSYDHCGIIIMDDKYEPNVLEGKPWHKVTITPLAKRLAQETDVQALLVPLELPREDQKRDDRIRNRLRAYAKNVDVFNAPTQAKDAVDLVLGGLVEAKMLEKDDKLEMITPGALARGKLELREGAKYGSPVPLRSK